METIKIRSLFLMMFAFVSLSSLAQSNSLTIARAEYKKGNYEDAVMLFNGALATESDVNTKMLIEKERALSSKCWKLLDQANYAYYRKNYEDAKRIYKTLLGINRYDSSSSYKHKQCLIMIQNAADDEFWAKVVASKDVDEYANYIERYPAGLHATEAKTVISNVAYDRELWNNAVAQNTKLSYQNYLSNSKYNWHKDEAQIKVYAFIDDELWANAQRINTKSAYQNYISSSKIKPKYTTKANAKVALFDAQSQYARSDYSNARRNYETYKKSYYSLVSSDAKAYLKCCEEDDYNEMQSYPSIELGKTFVSNYPYSKYNRNVKSLIARAYADEERFDLANSYSQYGSDKSYIRFKKRAYRKANRNPIECGLGFGNDWDFARNSYSYSIPVYFSIGSYKNLFNFKIGAQYKRLTGTNSVDDVLIEGDFGENKDGHRLFDFDKDHQPHLIANQVSIPVAMRFNMGDEHNAAQFFMEFGGSYNYNWGGKYKRYGFYDEDKDDGGGVDKFGNSDISMVNKFNISTVGKVGLMLNDYMNDTWWDIALVVRYDVSPVFNEAAINTPLNYNNSGNMINFYQEYNSIQNQVKNNLYFGVSIGVNFEL